MTFIYGICDPRNPEVIVYVGKANDLHGRMRVHLRTAIRGTVSNTYLYRWFRALLLQDVKPEMKILEEVSSGWEERERFWISHWRELNPELFNIHGGGNGPVDIIADETRRRLSKVWLGRHHRDETREKMSASHSQRDHSSWDYMRGENNQAKRPEVRSKITQGLLGREMSSTTCEKISKSRKGKALGDRNAMRRPEVVAKHRKPKSAATKLAFKRAWAYRKAIKLRWSMTFGWEDVVAL